MARHYPACNDVLTQDSHSQRVAGLASPLSLVAVACVVRVHHSTQHLRRSLNSGVVDIPVDALAVNSRIDDDLSSVAVSVYAGNLHGRKVRLAGIVYPTFVETGLHSNYLIAETRHRPCRIPAAVPVPLHALIEVNTANGQAEDCQVLPLVIEGMCEIDIRSEDSKVYSLYRMRDARIVTKNLLLQYTTALLIGILLHFNCKPSLLGARDHP